jgi:hypothetical protein
LATQTRRLVDFKTASGTVLMGTVVAIVAGKAEIVNATNQATVFGIALHDVDTALAAPTGSVARRGSFKGESLIVAAGTNAATLETALRDIGILCRREDHRSGVMRLRVNLISKRKYFEAGTEVPDSYVPDWCRIKHRCSDVEARQICEDRNLRRQAVAQQRAATERAANASRTTMT